MHMSLRVLGVFGTALFIAASGVMNFWFLSSQGHSAAEGKILGGVSVACTIFAALLPMVVGAAWRKRLRWLAVSAAGGWVFFFGFSLASGIGFAAMNRGAVTGDRDALNARHALAAKELAEVDAKLAAAVRPAHAVEQELNGLRLNPRWQASAQCGDAGASSTRQFCSDYFRLKAELETAIAQARLLARQAELRSEVKGLIGRGAGQEADPQASAIAALLKRILPRVDVGDVKLSLIVMVALLVETGAALGLYFFIGVGGMTAQPMERVAVQARAPDNVPDAVEPAEEPRRIAPPVIDAVATLIEAADGLREPQKFGREHSGGLVAALRG